MAIYKYGNLLQQEQGQEFDTVHSPGAATPLSGIYRCTGCGHSIVSTHSHPFPPQNHHQHAAGQGPIRWQLVVKTTLR